MLFRSVELVLPRNLFPAGHYTVKISSIDQAGEPAKPDYYAFEVIAR